MRSGKRVAKKQTRKLKINWRKWLVLIVTFVCGLKLYGYIIEEEKQSPNVQECQRRLNNIFSFAIKVENWTEKKAMEQVIDEFNQKHGYKGTKYQYQMYRAQDGYFWITSDFVHEKEFEMKAEQYSNSIMDMAAGVEGEEITYRFLYMTKEQRLNYEEMSLSCRMRFQDMVQIQEQHNTVNEVTFVIVTIKPKSNFVEESIIALSFLFNIATSKNIC